METHSKLLTSPPICSRKVPWLLESTSLSAAADIVVLHLDADFDHQLEVLKRKVPLLLPAQEILAVERYRRAADRLRAQASRLLQRLVLSSLSGIHPRSVCIERAATGSKPVWKPPLENVKDFVHFNVSHDERCVVLGASRYLVGVDCMRCSPRGNRSAAAFVRDMRGQCTAQDWSYITEASDSEQQLRRFMRVWTAKEAFVKALGTGVYTDPERLDCLFECSEGPPVICLDGNPQKDFCFHLNEKEAPGYVVCVCVGPPERALEDYQKQTPKGLEIHLPQITTPPPEAWRFVKCSFDDLVSAADEADKLTLL